MWSLGPCLNIEPFTTPSHTAPAKKQGPNKLRITLDSALFGPSLGVGAVWLEVVLGSMV